MNDRGHQYQCFVVIFCTAWAMLFAASAQPTIQPNIQSSIKSTTAMPASAVLHPSNCKITESAGQIVGESFADQMWTHRVIVLSPAQRSQRDLPMLFITGDKLAEGDAVFLRTLACATSSVVAVVTNIPNQPEKGSREGELLAASLRDFRDTGDRQKLLLEPMKAGVRKAMDYLQSEYEMGKHGFILAGVSKRAWVVWLTAAEDNRVRGIVPVAFDMLNVPGQVELARRLYGRDSEMLAPYAKLGLLSGLESVQAQQMLDVVDAGRKLSRLPMPKFLVLGSNDPYWVTGGTEAYWSEMLPIKHLLIVPNEKHDPLRDEGARRSVISWYRSMIDGVAPPQLGWSFDIQPDGRLGLVIHGSAPIVDAELWNAGGQSVDLRTSPWSVAAPPCSIFRGTAVCVLPPPRSPVRAVFARVTVSMGRGRTMTVTTGTAMQGDRKAR